MIAQASRLRIPGTWIILAGAAVSAVSILASGLGDLFWVLHFSFPVSMSVFLALDFTRTKRHLEERLVEVRTRLAAGDTVVLSSDGLSERFNADHEIFGEERVKAVLVDSGDRLPAEIIERLVAAGEEWGDGRPQNDDVTLAVLQVTRGDRTAEGTPNPGESG